MGSQHRVTFRVQLAGAYFGGGAFRRLLFKTRSPATSEIGDSHNGDPPGRPCREGEIGSATRRSRGAACNPDRATSRERLSRFPTPALSSFDGSVRLRSRSERGVFSESKFLESFRSREDTTQRTPKRATRDACRGSGDQPRANDGVQQVLFACSGERGRRPRKE